MARRPRELPMHSRRALRLAHVAAAALIGLAVAGGGSAAAVTGAVTLDPPTVQVENGADFTMKVVSTASIPLSGVSASITFNKAVLQVTSITRATAWSSAPLFLAADAKAITTANQKGKLQNVAGAFFPPGNVPSGNQDFITVGFKAIACGTVNMTMPTGAVDSSMLDGRDATYGAALKVTTAGATVTVCAGGGGSPAPGVSEPPTGESPGASSSFDTGATPAPGETAAGGGGGGTATPSPTPVPIAAGPVSDITPEQNSWLTFAMASLGVAALILVLTTAAIIASVFGVVFLYRWWRRNAAGRGVTVSAAAPASVTGPSDETARLGAADDEDPLQLPSGEQPVPAPNT